MSKLFASHLWVEAKSTLRKWRSTKGVVPPASLTVRNILLSEIRVEECVIHAGIAELACSCPYKC